MAQGSHKDMADGVCDSAILYEGGGVAGFIRYAPKSGYFLGWSLFVAPEASVKKGYTVV